MSNEQFQVPGKNALLKEPNKSLQDCIDEQQKKQDKQDCITSVVDKLTANLNITPPGPFNVAVRHIPHESMPVKSSADLIWFCGLNWENDPENVYTAHRATFCSSMNLENPKPTDGQSSDFPFIIDIASISARYISVWLANKERVQAIKNKRSDSGREQEISDDLIYKSPEHKEIISVGLNIPSWEDYAADFVDRRANGNAELAAKLAPTLGYFKLTKDKITRVCLDLTLIKFQTQPTLLLHSYLVTLWNGLKIQDLYRLAVEADPNMVDMKLFMKKYHSMPEGSLDH